MPAECKKCGKYFDFGNYKVDEHSLRQHMQVTTHCLKVIMSQLFNIKVHTPRNVPCPLCGEKMFRSATNAVQHVESGACKKCSGRDNARQQIHRLDTHGLCCHISVSYFVFRFMKSHEATRPFLNTKALTYEGSGLSGVPDTPYECRHCGKGYKHFSSLMQHQVHNKVCEYCHSRK